MSNSGTNFEALVGATGVAFEPPTSGDETGAKDTAAFNSIASLGSVIIKPGNKYYVTSLPSFGPGQGIRTLGGLESAIIYMVGTGVTLHCHNASFPTGGEKAVYENNTTAKFSGFTIDGSKASGAATGIQLGDIYGAEFDAVLVRGFTETGSVGWLFESEVGWLERAHIRNCHSVNNKTLIKYSKGGTATTSFMFCDIDIGLMAFPNQTGINLEKAVQLRSGRHRYYGNFYGGAGNTATVLSLGQDNSAVKVNNWFELDVECDGPVTAHTTIQRGTTAELHTLGSFIYSEGTRKFQNGNITLPDTRFTAAGQLEIDENIGRQQTGEALNIRGGKTESRGFATVTGGNVEFGVNGGNYFEATLVSGSNVVKINNQYPFAARTFIAKLKQPASGEAATLNLSSPGNNVIGNAMTITSSQGGGSLSLQKESNAIDLLQFQTIDGQNYYVSALTASASKTNLFLPKEVKTFKEPSAETNEKRAVIAESISRNTCNNTLILTSGTPIVGGIICPAKKVITALGVGVSAVEATQLDRTHLWCALLNEKGETLRVSGDYTSTTNTPMAASRINGLYLASTYETVSEELLYILFVEVMSATNPITIYGRESGAGIAGEEKPYISATANAGQTVPGSLQNPITFTAKNFTPYVVLL